MGRARSKPPRLQRRRPVKVSEWGSSSHQRQRTRVEIMGMSADDTIENLLLRAKCWHQEAARFAGPPEATICRENAQSADTLAELERLRKLDRNKGYRGVAWVG